MYFWNTEIEYFEITEWIKYLISVYNYVDYQNDYKLNKLKI